MMSLAYKLSFYLIIGTLVSSKECDKHGILIYEDLGCTPQYDNDKHCPTKYSCQGLEPSDKYCYFRGKSYQDTERIDSKLSLPSCDEACFCSLNQGRSSFTCAILDCPEWLGAPVAPGCYRKYSLDYCCSTGQVCPPFGNTEKCVVEGKEYKDGERFYPNNTCLSCVCQKGFKGKFEEPFCQRTKCGQQLRNSGDNIKKSCAPFYAKNSDNEVLCCPDDWICPDGSEVIKGEVTLEETCKFGNKTLKVGEKFEKLGIKDNYGRNFSKVECECVIPPLMKCTNVNV